MPRCEKDIGDTITRQSDKGFPKSKSYFVDKCLLLSLVKRVYVYIYRR